MKKMKLLSILTIVLLLGCEPQPINEVYLIPSGYSGQIAVVFGVKEGEKELIENGWRVYKIPEDGILITQSKFNDTWHTEKYYFIEDGKRIPIPKTYYGERKELKDKGLTDDDVFTCCGGASNFEDKYHFAMSFVGTVTELESKPGEYSKAFAFREGIRQKLEKVSGSKISF